MDGEAESPARGRDASPSRIEPYTDRDLCFHLQVYRDRRLARLCLASVREHFPGARLLLVSDGDDDPAWSALAARHGAEYVRGERLYAREAGGAIVQRMLDLYLAQPARWLIRIDTDTRLHRRFHWLPGSPCVFGTLEHRTVGHGEPLDPPCVQGGFMGFTHGAVLRLVASGVFQSEQLALDPPGTWADTRDTRERVRGGRVSFDHLVRYGARVAGVPAFDFPEVCSVWRGRIDNPNARYAATHPHKPWWQAWMSVVSVAVSRWRARR